jgi:hypothetical protein
MLKQISLTVNSLFKSRSARKNVEILELLLAAKYGSSDKAREVATGLRQHYPNDDDFLNAVSKELYCDACIKIMKVFEGVDSLQKLVVYKHKAGADEINFNISEQEASAFHDFYKAAMLVMPSILEQLMPEIAESLFADRISGKVRFTMREIRNEIGVSQRTFTKWSQYFFDEKYDGRKSVSLTEYIEIHERLMLKEDEDKFDFVFNNEEYLKRIDEGLVFSKARLAALTDSDYKTLQANCEGLVNDYKNFDIYPFRIAMKMLEKMG